MDRFRQALSDQSLKIVIAGIGNVLRSDDGVGPYIAMRLQGKDKRVILIPETGIERYITAINRETSDLIVFLDCVDFGRQPGFWDVIPATGIMDSTCHSHNISLKMLTRFFDADIWVVGVQPANIKVGESLSLPVLNAANEIITLINNC